MFLQAKIVQGDPFGRRQRFVEQGADVTVSSAGNPAVFGGGAVAPWTTQGVIDQMVASNWAHQTKKVTGATQTKEGR